MAIHPSRAGWIVVYSRQTGTHTHREHLVPQIQHTLIMAEATQNALISAKRKRAHYDMVNRWQASEIDAV